MSRKISEQVAALEDARDFYRDARDELIDKVDTLKAENTHIRKDRDQLRTENAELRAGRGRWPKGDGGSISATDSTEDVLNNRDPFTPVTAETIRQSEPGSTWDRKVGAYGYVYEWDGKYLRQQMKNGELSIDALVLRSGPTQLTRTTPAPRGDYGTPPRLTVHKLNVAPEGSLVDLGGSPAIFRKLDGDWIDQDGEHVTPEGVIRGFPNATITYPQDAPEPEPEVPRPKRFYLVRDEDETGVSGTGKVAEGIIYSDGHVSLRWIVGQHRSTVAYDSITAVEAVHGHGGKTRVVVDDE